MISSWPWWNWLILLAIIGLVAFFFVNKKKQDAKGGGRPKQRGIIK